MATDHEPAPRLDAEGPASPPRRNGELVFAAPWESRAFGLVHALHERGLFGWDEFRAELIGAIGAWDREHPGGAGYSYWERWLEAFERLLAAKGLAAPGGIRAERGAHAD